LKHCGEELGFKATLEAPVASGGRVDVLFERGGQSIACEISIASAPDHELENAKKCLTGGFARIVIVSPDRKRLKRIGTLAGQQLSEVDRARVNYCTPEEVLELLKQVPDPTADRESTVLGYKVKTSIKPLTPEEQAARKESILRTILQSLKRFKGAE
jgi:hypothetical protein